MDPEVSSVSGELGDRVNQGPFLSHTREIDGPIKTEGGGLQSGFPLLFYNATTISRTRGQVFNHPFYPRGLEKPGVESYPELFVTDSDDAQAPSGFPVAPLKGPYVAAPPQVHS